MERFPLDADERAILFLCCSQHVLNCPACRNTFRLGWLGPIGRDAHPCPMCGAELGPVIVAHSRTCDNFAARQARKPPTKVTRQMPRPEAATA